MKSVPVLLFSQLSNFAAIISFVLFSNTTDYAKYIFIVFIAQIIWPLLTFRIEVQQQVELDHRKQLYFLGVSLQVLLITATAFVLATVFFSLTLNFILSLFAAVSLSVIGIVRSYAIARPDNKPIVMFEFLNIIKNLIALITCGMAFDISVIYIFIFANYIQAIVLVGVSIYLLRPIARLLKWKFFKAVIIRRTKNILRFTFPNSLFGMLSSRLPFIALEAAHSGASASAFVAANRMSLSPLSLILYALRVFGVKELNKRRKGQANKFRPLFFSILIITPFILSPMLFPALLKPAFASFDPSWIKALDLLPWLYPLSVLFFTTGWMDRVFDIWGKQHIIFNIEIMVLITAVLLYILISYGVLSSINSQIAIVFLGIIQSALWLGAFVLVEFFTPRKTHN